MAAWVMGLDVGTSSVKALALDAAGRVLGYGAAAYGIERPQTGWAEQAPETWWQAACAAIASLLAQTALNPRDLHAIGTSGQMHGAVVVGADDQPLRPAIIWADGRTADEITTLDARITRADLLRITGNPPSAGMMALSLLWLQKHAPEVWRQTRRVLLPKDYLGLRLTGRAATDPSDAAGTLLFDLAARCWSDAICAACGVSLDLLPPIVESGTVIGRLTAEAANATGLVAGVPVVVGGGDSPCAALAQGVTTPDSLGCTIGTAAQIVWPTVMPQIDPAGRLHSLCHVLPQRWYTMGATLNGGAALAWLAGLWPDAALETLLAEAANVPPGADGLIFLPYLNGERSPHMDANARGLFFGLAPTHGRPHLTRAVLEGVAFALADSLAIFRDLGLAGTPTVRLSGGAARSPLWAQIVADIFALPVAVADSAHGSAQGAALLAGLGAGFWPDPTTHPAPPAHTCTPARTAAYATLHDLYRDLYPALHASFQKLRQPR